VLARAAAAALSEGLAIQAGESDFSVACIAAPIRDNFGALPVDDFNRRAGCETPAKGSRFDVAGPAKCQAYRGAAGLAPRSP